jgi:hypothetical protein
VAPFDKKKIGVHVTLEVGPCDAHNKKRIYVLQVSEDFLKSGGREAKAGVEIESTSQDRPHGNGAFRAMVTPAAMGVNPPMDIELLLMNADDLADPEVLGIFICICLNSNPETRSKVEMVNVWSALTMHNLDPGLKVKQWTIQ